MRRGAYCPRMGLTMRLLFLEPFAGISGDMLLGALVDLGVPVGVLQAQVEALGLGDRVELKAAKTERGGVAATKVDVIVDGRLEVPDEPDGPCVAGTTVGQVLDRLDTSSLEPGVREKAGEVFRSLAGAEARVHGSSPGRVHLHETGAIDAVVDVVCGVAAVSSLGVEKILSTPPCEGHGQIESAHGTLPIPAPATAFLLEGIPVQRIDVPYELVTPTGAAMLVSLADSFTFGVSLTPERVGYGAGTRELADRPNVLRVTLGVVEETVGNPRDKIAVLETTVDDALPEMWPHLIGRLLEAGARDAYIVPVVMKKGRPGIHLTVLGDPADLNRLERLVFEETGTLGVRVTETDRVVLRRARGRLETALGPLLVKLSRLPGENHWRVHPEYEACREAAMAHGMPLRDVYSEVARAASAEGMLTVEESTEDEEESAPSGTHPIIDRDTGTETD